MIVLSNLIFAEWNDTSQITCLQNVSAAEALERRFAIAIADPVILNVKAEKLGHSDYTFYRKRFPLSVNSL